MYIVVCGTYLTSCTATPEEESISSIAEISFENTVDLSDIVSIRKRETFYNTSDCSGNAVYIIESHYATTYLSDSRGSSFR